MECFGELEGKDPEEINALIIQDIRTKEHELELARARNNTPVLGARMLQQADIRKAYIPQTHDLSKLDTRIPPGLHKVLQRLHRLPDSRTSAAQR